MLDRFCAVGLVVVAMTTLATAGTVDFEDIVPTDGNRPAFGSPLCGPACPTETVTSGGFEFGAPGPTAADHAHLMSDPVNTDPDQTHYYATNGTQHIGIDAKFITMEREGGGLFDFLSFDAAEGFLGGREATDANGPYLHEGAAAQLRVVGELASGGTVSALFDFDGINDSVLGDEEDFESFLLPHTFRDLVFVSFTGIHSDGTARAGHFGIDDLEVSVVPLPPAAWMGLLLLGTLVASTRRRS